MLPAILTVNPFMTQKHHRRAKHKRAKNRLHARRRSHKAKNAFGHRRRRKSHNPFKFSTRSATHDVTAALIGAGGAIGTDIAMAYAAPYLPAFLQTGWGNIAARALAAVGVGMIAGKVAGRETGKGVTAGGLIVVAYSGLKQVLAPTLGANIKGLSGLADFGDYSQVPYSQQPGAMLGTGMGAYMQPRMGAYMAPGRLGAYMSPGSIVSPLRAKQLAGFGGFNGTYSDDM